MNNFPQSLFPWLSRQLLFQDFYGRGNPELSHHIRIPVLPVKTLFRLCIKYNTMYYTILYYTILYYTILYYTILYYAMSSTLIYFYNNSNNNNNNTNSKHFITLTCHGYYRKKNLHVIPYICTTSWVNWHQDMPTPWARKKLAVLVVSMEPEKYST